MTINNYMTQPEMIEYYLKLLENGKIHFDNHTLNTLLPHYVMKVTKTKILFFNKHNEVIIDFLNDYFYKSGLNESDDKDFYKKPKNFDYLFIEHNMEENIVYFYEKRITKKSVTKYLKKVRVFLALLPN